MIKYLAAGFAALALSFGISAVALAGAGGVGVGITGGTYSAGAASSGLVAGVIVGGQTGTFSQSAGTKSYASAGMAIGVDSGTTFSFAFDGIDNGVVDLTNHSSASLQGFGTAGSETTITYAGNGAHIGLGVHFAASNGSGRSNGAFLGVGLIAAVEP